MKMLSLTQASKSFSDCLERVYSQKESFAITKLGILYAMLVSAPPAACNSHELADDLAKSNMSQRERCAFGAALEKGRKMLKPLKNPWG
jgi:hypothetical protein